jgi:hypothetical protein
LWIVPARVAGTWQLAEGELRLRQTFQKLSGTLSSGKVRVPIKNGLMRGNAISFSVGDTQYTGAAAVPADGRRNFPINAPRLLHPDGNSGMSSGDGE